VTCQVVKADILERSAQLRRYLSAGLSIPSEMAGHIDSRYRSGDHWHRSQITCSARVIWVIAASQNPWSKQLIPKNRVRFRNVLTGLQEPECSIGND